MEPAAERAGQGLGLKMIIERCAVPPYLVAPELDEAGAQHDAEGEPAEKDDDLEGRGRFGKGRISSRGQRKIARKPVSRSWISQPKPYHS